MTETHDPGKEARAASGIPVVGIFDGYRGIAIFLVVVYHVCLYSGVSVAAGDSALGVAIFGGLAQVPLTMLFIVSGFVLYLPTASRNGTFGSVRAFAVRRAARIYPAYLLGLAISLVILVAVPAVGPLPGVGTVALHLGMLQSPATLFDSNFALGLGVIPAVWTLSVETAFYIVLPLIAVAYFRRPLVGLAIAAVMLVAWHELALNINAVGDALGFGVSAAAKERWATGYASQFPNWGLAIACGMSGALAFVRLRERFEPEVLARRAPVVAYGALAATLVVAAIAGHQAVEDQNILTGAFARQSLFVGLALPLAIGATMMALALSPRRAQLGLASAPMRWLGDISYGVYIIHLAVLNVAAAELGLSRSGSLGAFLAWLSIAVVTSNVYAWFSATLVERPARRHARRLVGSARAATPGSVPPAAPTPAPDPPGSRS